MAVFLAWDGALEVAGLIMVAPPLIRSGVWDPDTDRRVPTYIVVGEHDRSLSGCRDLHQRMQGAGAPVHLDQRPGLGHQLPDDLAETIASTLDWINHQS